MKKLLFISVIFIFCIGISCINNYPDNDLWARLIAGAHIVENFSILKYDFLSYTQTHKWYDHEWGASIFLYLALKYFGDTGLILLKGILSALMVFFCYKIVELRNPKSTHSYNILYYLIMFLVAFKIFGATTRCLLFTCLFYSIFLYILELSRKGKDKLLFLLPVIMLFWGNIHGGCLSGIGIIGVYIIGEYLNKKPIKKYIYTLLGCLGVLFINPYGYEYVKFLFMAGTMDRGYIAEWLSPFDTHFAGSYIRYKIYLIVMLLSQIIYLFKYKINYDKIDKTKIILLLIMTFLSVTHIRHITFFVFTVAALLYDEFYDILNSVIQKICDILKIKNENLKKSVISLKEISIYLLIIMLSTPPLLAPNKEIKITGTEYPRFAIEFIKINNIKGNLLINFDWGSYAAYKLYPNNKISMDGRYEEVYNQDLFIDLKNFYMMKKGWDKILKDYKTDVMVLEKKYPVYNKILETPEWKLVFENNLSGVFVPVKNVQEVYYLPPVDDNYYNKTKFETDIKFGD